MGRERPRMLIEILTFFAVASALATLVCLAKGVPAWSWPRAAWPRR